MRMFIHFPNRDSSIISLASSHVHHSHTTHTTLTQHSHNTHTPLAHYTHTPLAHTKDQSWARIIFLSTCRVVLSTCHRGVFSAFPCVISVSHQASSFYKCAINKNFRAINFQHLKPVSTPVCTRSSLPPLLAVNFTPHYQRSSSIRRSSSTPPTASHFRPAIVVSRGEGLRGETRDRQ